jgi:prophage regulatory protein
MKMALRLLRLAEVRARVPLSKTAIYDLMAAGEFPKPVKLGVRTRAVAWVADDIEKYIDGLLGVTASTRTSRTAE